MNLTAEGDAGDVPDRHRSRPGGRGEIPPDGQRGGSLRRWPVSARPTAARAGQPPPSASARCVLR
jgi:hypothetical protein